MDDRNAVIDAIDAGHIASSASDSGVYSKFALCKKDGQPFPCQIILAARATNARREAARNSAELRKLAVP